MNTLKEKITRWYADGERGSSSETMARYFSGIRALGYECDHPHDPSDFNRCLIFLEFVPEARERLSEIGKLTPEWAALVDRWDEIERSFWDEVAASLDSARQRWTAPKTLAMMREALNGVSDDRV